MIDIQDFHKRFHDVLGHLTAIHSAASVLVEDHLDKLTPEVAPLVQGINQHAESMVNELLILKEKVYGELEHKNIEDRSQ